MLSMHDWMKRHDTAATSLYEMSHGKGVWEAVQANAALRAAFYDSMDADSRLVMPAVLSESPGVFQGLTSLVDVGGGRGTAAAAISPGRSRTSSAPSWTSLTSPPRLPPAPECASLPVICLTTSHRPMHFCSSGFCMTGMMLTASR